MQGRTVVRITFLLVLLSVVGEAYHTGINHLIRKRSTVCHDKEGHIWYQNECACRDRKYKCCCGSEGMFWCEEMISCY